MASVVDFNLRIVFGTVLIIIAGTTAVVSYVNVVEPFVQAFPAPPDALGWGDPGAHAAEMAAASMLGVMVVITVWQIVAPIQNDRLQDVRRR